MSWCAVVLASMQSKLKCAAEPNTVSLLVRGPMPNLDSCLYIWQGHSAFLQDHERGRVSCLGGLHYICLPLQPPWTQLL